MGTREPGFVFPTPITTLLPLWFGMTFLECTLFGWFLVLELGAPWLLLLTLFILCAAWLALACSASLRADILAIFLIFWSRLLWHPRREYSFFKKTWGLRSARAAILGLVLFPFLKIRSKPPTCSYSPLILHKNKLYIISKFTMVRVSSSRSHFIFWSSGVVAVIEGLPLISISHGFNVLSSMISNPYS